MAYETQNITLSENLVGIIRNSLNKDGNLHLLKRLDKIIKWDEITEIVTRYLPEASGGTYRNNKVLTLIKCLILENIFNFSDYKLFVELADKDPYQNFIGIDSPTKIPKVKIVSSFRSDLILNSIYEMVIEKFNEQLDERKAEILDSGLRDDEKEQNIIKYETKMLEIEDRISKLSENTFPSILSGTDFDTAYDLRDNLLRIKKQVDRLSGEKFDPESENYQKMLKVENSIININGIAEKLENNKNSDKETIEPESERTEELHNKIINSFYISLEENVSKDKDETATIDFEADNIIQEKLKYTNRIIEELKDSLKNLDEISASKEIPEPEKLNGNETGIQLEDEKIETEIETKTETEIETKTETEIETKTETEIETKTETEIETKTEAETELETKIDTYTETYLTLPELETEAIPEKEIDFPNPLVIYPRKKTEGIFNDENLTEDYELGFRFHQLGLKMGFFNVMLDSHNESTRISTAEFFPNTFWSSVKQRSRWIAGVCFQNWKAHKWKGDLTTKYFMFRDRKPLFSILGAFLSNMIFFYMILAIVCNIFKIADLDFVIKSNSILWYILLANLFFMISRVVQRFAFTYNWYGFRFAFFSVTRLVMDTFINFFAVLRSLKVYNQTKKKVVWDSTTHY
jgi:hypothetical protein